MTLWWRKNRHGERHSTGMSYSVLMRGGERWRLKWEEGNKAGKEIDLKKDTEVSYSYFMRGWT